MFRTKIIIILGYLLLIALSIAGIAWIYSEWLNYTKGALPYQQHQKELSILSNTLASMYNAESSVGLLAFVTDPQLNQKYDSLTSASFAQIAHLKQTSKEPALNAQLDSLHLLLARKKNNTSELLLLVQSFEADTLKQITQTTILSQHDLRNLDKLLNNSFQQFRDTSLIIGKRKNVFRRIGDAIKSSEPDTLREINSYATHTKLELVLPLLKDTIVSMINHINQASQRRNAALTAQLLAKQNDLYNINEHTTAQINSIIADLEASEYSDSLRRTAELAETIRRSSVATSIIAIASILIAVFFMSWILRSLTVNHRLHQQINLAKKHLEELLASRERLILTITHDIKAPVSSILGYLELMTKDNLPPQDLPIIENMQHSAANILNLVHNLLDYSALEIEQKPDTLPFSPHNLLADIHKSFLPNAQKKNLHFLFLPDMHLDRLLLGDPNRIRQIINNLLSNAIKYTPQNGSISLSAQILPLNNNNPTLQIAVQDTGPGIHPDDQKRIFEPFKRLDYTGSDIEGLGLGLNISIKLAELLGGTLTVHSAPAEGSTFTLRLPLQPFPQALATQPLQVLFIDDDPIQLDLVSRITAPQGITPHTCSTAPAALQALHEKHFDLIFSDIQMPETDGFALVKQIRAASFKGASTIPIIALSAHSTLPQQQYLQAGFTGFLLKPFTAPQLIQTIFHYTQNEGPVPPENPAPPAQGFDRLIELSGGDWQSAQSVLWSFVADNQKHYLQLEQAFANDDWNTIQQISHKMTSVMKLISATDLLPLLEKYNAGSRDKTDHALFLSLLKETIRNAAQFISKHIKN
jgi:signal transduction histidine kinase/ActR/RegA family two-component response regulator